MRVLLDTSFTLRGPSGTGVYIDRLSAALEAEGVDVVRAANADVGRPGRGRAQSAANLLGDLRWTAVELPRLARAARVDVIHHPLPDVRPAGAGSPGDHRPRPRLPQPPRHVRPPLRPSGRRRTHRLAARRADAVICVSEATRVELRDRFGVDGIVARHGPGQAPDVPPPPWPPATSSMSATTSRARISRRCAPRTPGSAPGAPPLEIAGGAGQPVSRERLEAAPRRRDRPRPSRPGPRASA